MAISRGTVNLPMTLAIRLRLGSRKTSPQRRTRRVVVRNAHRRFPQQVRIGATDTQLESELHPFVFGSRSLRGNREGAVRGRLTRVQNSAEGGGSLYKRVGEPLNDGMGEAFFGHAVLDVGNMVGELLCEFIDALNHGIGIDVQLLGQLEMKPDIAQAIFATELHGKFDTFDVNVRVR